MPTRIVHGIGALDNIEAIVREQGISRPLLVTDAAIRSAEFFRRAEAHLARTYPDMALFDGCGIDARLSHVLEQSKRAATDRIDGVIGIGGGSVLCTAKAIAASVASGELGLPGLVKSGRGPGARLMPVIAVPTTAGSGSEVSQFTVVKNDIDGGKLIYGGPWAFPSVAVLDPAVLSTLPRRLAVRAAVDALTHSIEAIFSSLATPLTDALAFQAMRMLVSSMRGSIMDGNPDAQNENQLGACIANMACGNTKLCLAHAIGTRVEGELGLEHGLAVGVLMPHVARFNAPAAPDRAAALCAILEGTSSNASGDVQARLVKAFEAFYQTIDFPMRYPAEADSDKIMRIAQLSAQGLYGEGAPALTRTANIPSPNIRQATVADAQQILEQCF